MVCGCGKQAEDQEWEQKYMKQFLVTRQDVKPKVIGWVEKAVLVHLNGVLAFRSMIKALMFGDKFVKCLQKVPGLGALITPVVFIADLATKIVGVVLGMIAYLVCFFGGYMFYRFKSVPVYVRLPISSSVVVLGMESYLKREVKKGMCIQRNDPVTEQLLVEKVIFEGAPWNASYRLQVAPGKCTKWASLIGRSVGIFLEVTILGKTRSTTDMKIDCIFADDICCCCGRIFPVKPVLKRFAERVLLGVLQVRLKRDDCNTCYLSKTHEDDLSLDRMADVLKMTNSAKVLPDGMSGVLGGVPEEGGIVQKVLRNSFRAEMPEQPDIKLDQGVNVVQAWGSEDEDDADEDLDKKGDASNYIAERLKSIQKREKAVEVREKAIQIREEAAAAIV